MEFDRMIFVLVVVLAVFSSVCEASAVGNAQYNSTQHNHDHNNHDHYEPLQCYSCISIEKFPNMSAEGCAKRSPPSNYLTKDCFGYNSPIALAAIRHQVTSGKFGHGPEDPMNVHCVHIKGTSDAGGQINIRGCATLPKEEIYQGKTCIPGNDLMLIPVGMVKEVEYCYCKGTGCNTSPKFGPTNIFAGLLLTVIAITNKLTNSL
ncbi:uncharacterized protein LOC110856339 isoform X2 [Folsomia candida]|uniref:uncharacterized protein LOC110856339 isoform X2 n=1 Tax=Folsomia candida TaxID=158441 RepID=UPI000B9046A5|nr:uncharacterized protein LOC110856339 isoform X2 [Folsomia candida]